MNFGEILSKAWKVIWKHKILWLFGILAGCGATRSGGGGSSVSISNFTQNGSWESPDFLAPSAQRTVEGFFRSLADIQPGVWVAIALGAFLAAVVFSALSLMVGTLGSTGIIKGTSMADQAGEDAKPLSLGAIFKGLKPYYWRVFLLNLGLRVGGFVLTLMLIIPGILFAVLTLGFGLLLMILIGWFINLMVYFATIAIVEEDKGLFPAIGRAWEVLVTNFGNVIVMFLILGVGQIVIGLLLSLPIFAAFVPLLVNGIATSFQTLTTGLTVTGVLLLVFIPVTVFLNGVLRAYVWSAWTLTYRRLINKEPLAPEVLLAKESEDPAA